MWEMSDGAENPWTFSRAPHPLELWIYNQFIKTPSEQSPSVRKGF